MLGVATQYLYYQYLWLVGLFPLLVLIDRLQALQHSFLKKVATSLLCCWLTASVASVLGAPWIAHSLEVFGHLPYWIALAINGFGYGLELGGILFVCFVLPCFLIRQPLVADLPFRIFLALFFDAQYPRFFHWSFGSMTFRQTPFLSQAADLIGATGLGFFVIGSNFLLLGLWRSFECQSNSTQVNLTQPFALLKKFTCIYVLMFLMTFSYGFWREFDLKPTLNQGQPLQVVTIQPNFSLANLASNPDLTFSKRAYNISGLIDDSIKELEKSPSSSVPSLVVWPESTFSSAYFHNQKAREIVKSFVQNANVYLLLTTIGWDLIEGERKYYSSSLLLNPDGEVIGKYDKILLIPFGEYIPFADVAPWFGRFVKRVIPQVSQFEAGQEYSVFKISENLQLTGTICFDMFDPEIPRQMVQNGTQFIVNLSNLAWFGRTNASDMLENMIRWNAIETRVPFLYASNNGETKFVNLLGKVEGRVLGLFQEGAFTHTVKLSKRFSFYREFKNSLGYFLFFICMVLTLFLWKDRILHFNFNPHRKGSML